MVEAIIILGLIIAAGVWFGQQGTVSTRTPGSNKKDVAQCEDACDQFDTRRAERCLAEQDQANAQQHVQTIRDLLLALVAGSVTLLVAVIGGAGGAAALVTAIPALAPIMPLLLAVLAIGVAVAAAAIIALFAALITAEVDLGNKRRAATAARDVEAEARDIMLQVCPDAESEQCLARPAPC